MEIETKSVFRAIDIIIESVTKMGESFLSSIPNIFLSLVILGATWIVYRIAYKTLSNFFEKINLRASLTELFLKLTSIFIWIFGSLVAATVVFPGLTPAKLVTLLRLGSIAIGFAFKDIFENFLTGILILLREPFKIGDFVDCEGGEGY